MKILRKRKGFSTNSSSSFEWVPPGATDAGGSASPGPASATAHPAATAAQVVQPATLPATAPAASFSSSHPLFGIGLVGLLICGLFIVEEVIRRLWKKIRGKQHED